jgi:hypothetical protein
MASPAASAADVAAEAARLDAALVADAADTLGGSRETKEPGAHAARVCVRAHAARVRERVRTCALACMSADRARGIYRLLHLFLRDSSIDRTNKYGRATF